MVLKIDGGCTMRLCLLVFESGQLLKFGPGSSLYSQVANQLAFCMYVPIPL